MSTKNATNMATSKGPRLYLKASSFNSTTAAATMKAATPKYGASVFGVRKTSSDPRSEVPITTFPRDGKVSKGLR